MSRIDLGAVGGDVAIMGIFSSLFGPPSKEKFAAILQKALRRAGDTRPFVYDAVQERLALPGEESRHCINLVNFYLIFLQLPRSERQEWLRKTCIGLLTNIEIPSDFEDAKPDLRLALRSRCSLELARLQSEGDGGEWKDYPGIEVSEHLTASLVYDLPNSMRFVVQDDLDQWGVTLYEAMEVARQNLEEESPSQIAALGDSLYVIQTGDSYDSTRMLTLEFLRKLKVTGQTVALPAGRDCLLISGSEDVAGTTLMAQLAEEQVEAPRPLCFVPHVLEGDAWTVWNVPDEHPAAAQFKMLALRSTGGEYAEQKPLLERWLASKGWEHYVAEFSAAGNEKTNEFYSYCVWTKGVPTWLPKADRIAFVSPATNGAVMLSWDDAVRRFGKLMQARDVWPPRWLVSEFPEPSQLAAAHRQLS